MCINDLNGEMGCGFQFVSTVATENAGEQGCAEREKLFGGLLGHGLLLCRCNTPPCGGCNYL